MPSITYQNVENFEWREKILLRALYFDENGELVVRRYDPSTGQEKSEITRSVASVVQDFFNEVLERFFGIK
jgi:hypothetical protein